MTQYSVYIVPNAWEEVKALPGHIRQQVRRSIHSLADNPRPSDGKQFDFPDVEYELWRLRLDRWRILYAITDSEATVDILAVRKRPPYDYGNLSDLLARLS